jgi:dynein heavy chain
MMSALRLVWIISRYYSDDACMGSLMERIAYQVIDKHLIKKFNIKLFNPH